MKNKNFKLEKKQIQNIKLVDSWSLSSILADFIKGFEALDNLGPTIAFFGSARTKEDDFYYKQAQQLSSILAKKGFNIMSGGGPGIMEASNRGAIKYKDVESIGLNINLPDEQESNLYTTKELKFDYLFSRKVMLIKYSISYVFFPGGFGTLDELFEVITLVKTKKFIGVKIFLIGKEFYEPLIFFLKDKVCKNGMISKENLEIIILTDDLKFIVKEIESSLNSQMKVLKDIGLNKTNYYKSLKSFKKLKKKNK